MFRWSADQTRAYIDRSLPVVTPRGIAVWTEEDAWLAMVGKYFMVARPRIDPQLATGKLRLLYLNGERPVGFPGFVDTEFMLLG